MRSVIIIFLFANAFAQTGGSEFHWTLKKQTIFKDQVYQTFQNQDGDQVVKKRAPKSPDRPEEPTVKNLPNRQAIFEWGIGFGFSKASKQSLQWQKGERTGEFGELYDGSPTDYQNPVLWDVNFAVHPPVKFLKGLTVGVSMNANMSQDGDKGDTTGHYEGDKYIVDKFSGQHQAAPDMSFNLIAAHDFWYIPAGKSMAIFSAGAYYGYKSAQFHAGNREFREDFTRDRGLVIKYRQLFDDYDRAFTNLYIQTMISEDHTFRMTFGWQMMWGRANAPKTKVEK